MIPLMQVHKPKNIGNVLQKVWDSGFVTEGEYSDKFEEKFGHYIGNPNVSLMNSCTSALWMASHMCGVKPGDEVITTAMTCMATNVPFVNMGANLVFADIDPLTGNIDPDSIEEKITKKTRAIVLVHWAGQPCKMDLILDIAKKYQIKVVEDAAHALRARYNDIMIGNHGDYVCFSFQAVKHLTTADGGAIVCKQKEDVDRIRKLRWFGLDRHYKSPPGQAPASRWEQDIVEAGYKLHMNNLNAAIGLEQLKYIDQIIDKHIENALFFDKHLKNSHITMLKRDPKAEPTFWIYSILVNGNKQKFKDYLEQNKIASDVVHVRNDQYSCFKNFRNNTLEGLKTFSERLLHLPVGWWVSEKDREHIVNIVNDYR